MNRLVESKKMFRSPSTSFYVAKEICAVEQKKLWNFLLFQNQKSYLVCFLLLFFAIAFNKKVDRRILCAKSDRLVLKMYVTRNWQISNYEWRKRKLGTRLASRTNHSRKSIKYRNRNSSPDVAECFDRQFILLMNIRANKLCRIINQATDIVSRKRSSRWRQLKENLRTMIFSRLTTCGSIWQAPHTRELSSKRKNSYLFIVDLQQ